MKMKPKQLKPGMVFEYVSVPTKDKINEPELLIIINITPLPVAARYNGGVIRKDRKMLDVYKVEDSQMHVISSCTLLSYYKPFYPAETEEKKNEA